MNSSQRLVRSSLLLAIAIIVQGIGRSFPQISQLLVGSIVNAVLIISTLTCGVLWGILVGGLTPLLAWIIGQLPAPMGPFIPFIMLGNIIFILMFSLGHKRENWIPYIFLVIAAIFKFGFLYMSANKFINLFNLGIPPKVASKLVIMMGTPQLITALIGGFGGIILTNMLTKRKVI
ncbi:hypothetical protein BD780_001816 [Clostridium tetanomorphum]|uniref:ECF transporter S component n=1 Tax=Clostridium tetanomorphum TaxID=1553 RepID=A0A923ECQ0_CLOTT|nr:ECF transporter S component [Clostridium tetanomorphum]KAJ52499.1 membrane spanning protein [Clostridium tetanomorphum DSM 665]MBC2399469.1 ECF transporter S component [Clostridium tetanomorphum]MBP1864178.1 hypothetical protein [Clostridium tetanomorphum]NRS84591.1 hypothetical protein [Clostridium tetanomorphum]NRZ97806.1 hypothetical protein [Clostridium tetanomorphum]